MALFKIRSFRSADATWVTRKFSGKRLVVDEGDGWKKEKADAVEKLNAEVAAMKTKAEGELKPVEAKIAAMKSDADKATGDAKKDGEAKVTEANGMLAKIKEQLASLGGLKDMASFTALKDKVMGMIADLKKKVGL